MTLRLDLPHGQTLIRGKRPLIMGIVNITPDSFSDGGDFVTAESAVAHGLALAADGADILDIGGESTRPGHHPIGAEEELFRVLPVVEALARQTNVTISIDTWKPEVAERALAAGASMVNDVWGFQRDPQLASVTAAAGAAAVLMYNRIAVAPELDILSDMMTYLERSVNLARKAGIPQSHIFVDPGVGFGKTPEQNLLLMRHIDKLRSFGCGVMMAVSRKSTLGLITNQPKPKDRLAGTLAANLWSIRCGADLLRVHDVRPHVDALKVWAAIEEAK